MKGFTIFMCALNGVFMLAGIALDLGGVIIAGNSLVFGASLMAIVYE